ncbi:ABC transporter ATP-binding protein [Staphylococcus canis]|uniref:ABC transporter ATP-binding protein n=1 Tax=Staphylococcus canis TaxID=2724942 RepID=A0ABS0T7U7_9STAP|nr:ABC transporter ATP-binding protein [Staphylococcus canis]MBI5974820.1 ABC transporter ATP-binding protein [Staphylococcus canis]
MIARLSNVKKEIKGRHIIDDITFELEAGSIHVILGPNGVGKTTTIRLMTGLLKPDSGDIEVLQHNSKHHDFDRVRKHIGVQNDGNLYENLTVLDNLNLWAEFYEVPKDKRDRNIKELLTLFDLDDRKDSQVGTLSKGMKQKVSIIRALIHEPQLLILDEPTSGLDPSTSELLITHIQKIVREKGTTVFMCTHHLHGLEEIADHIYIMSKGNFIADGAPNALLREAWPYHEFDIETSDIQKTVDALKDTYTLDANEKSIRIRLDQYRDISQVIRYVLNQNIEVYTAIPVQHSIKEYYLKKLGDLNAHQV